jgi:hypothetical protein
MSSSLQRLCLLALGLALGVVFVVLACTRVFDDAIAPSFAPAYGALAFIAAATPSCLCRGALCGAAERGYARLMTLDGGGGYDAPSSACPLSTYFVTGALVVVGAGLPLVLAHTHVVAFESAALALGGGALIFATMSGYVEAFGRGGGDDDNAFFSD